MPEHDVRMKGFLERTDLSVALERLLENLQPLDAETVPLQEALGRALAEDVVASVDVPAFAKSAVDGYGLKARETFGSSPSNPIRFDLVGEVMPGATSTFWVSSSTAILKKRLGLLKS